MIVKKLESEGNGYNYLGVAQETNSRALDLGVRLAGICGNIWPADDELFVRRIEQQIIDTAFQFAFNVRRVLDFELKEYSIPRDTKIPVGELWKLEINQPLVRPDLRKACNKLVHAEHVAAISWINGNERFTSLRDRRFSHLEIKADANSVYHVCPYSMVYAFLSRKDHYPKGAI
ncbi:hypothetical protein [Rhodalgimonas zhirmunskyi]|uniref:Uncharacterized protein n=1 Tax=Rhodalgimonas zhirmunskyi TaxID=2964767 RepID=A0AAJ1UAA9_9RHOB|nr:hypothetical protein [Rhodoalgimonas zhirmunskyi]MDQ2094710.1 hypothetical protein [Rhodoalgimonas zhirmunskyi]